jgi:hypothetical protein
MALDCFLLAAHMEHDLAGKSQTREELLQQIMETSDLERKSE